MSRSWRRRKLGRAFLAAGNGNAQAQRGRDVASHLWVAVKVAKGQGPVSTFYPEGAGSHWSREGTIRLESWKDHSSAQWLLQ